MSAQLKTLIDRFCAFNTSIQGRHMASAILAAAWNSDGGAFEALEAHYRTLARYLNLRDMGAVWGKGCGTPSMTSHSPYPRQAYELGKSLKRITSLFLAAVLCMGLSIPASAAVEDTGFFDVDADAWYADAVEYCVDNGLMSGTSADVDYTDSASRSQAEGRDPDARPAISSGVENMEDYEIIFLGYPIWNGQAPRIISTFLETYDFDGKTIVPFCSSIFSYTG